MELVGLGLTFDMTRRGVLALPTDAVARGSVTYFDRGAQVVNVMAPPFRATGDGETDDTSAIVNAQGVLDEGGVLYFPPGTYLLSGNGPILRKSNVTWRGSGMHQTVLTGAITNLILSSSSFPCQNVTFEDIGFAPSVTTGNCLNIDGHYIQGLNVRRCRFVDAGCGISLSGVTNATIEHCEFHGLGKSLMTGINVLATCRSITIKNNRFLYLLNGIVIDTGAPANGVHTEQVAEDLWVEGNYFDLGWYTLPIRGTHFGSGATVSYSATVLTDSAAAFPSITSGLQNNVRAMPVIQTGTGTISRNRVTDASATFTTNVVRRGQILTMSGAWAIIREVQSETVLTVEEWLDPDDRLPIAAPATGAYTIYNVLIGRISSTTGTTITVDRFHDLDGVSRTPAAETRYELMNVRSNYPINAEAGVRDSMFIGNRLYRGWSDQLSCYGTDNQFLNNRSIDGQDMGLTVHGKNNQVIGHKSIHNGAGGFSIYIQEDSVYQSCTGINNQWVNQTDGTLLGDFLVWSCDNVTLDNCVSKRTTSRGRYGVTVYHDQFSDSATVTGNKIVNHRSSGHLTAEYHVHATADQTVDGTQFIDCESASGDVAELVQDGAGTITNTLFMKHGQARPVAKGASFTCGVAESGQTYVFTAADVVATLPATKPGLRYTFVSLVPSGGTGSAISPNAADKIFGSGITAADNKDIINSGASDTVGDSITVVGDIAGDGWLITQITGTWAREG